MSRRPAVLLLGGLLAGVLLAVGLVALTDVIDQDRPEDSAGSSRLAVPRPKQVAPVPAVRRLHSAVHTLGRSCKPRSSTEQTTRVRRSVGVIIEFARRYPAVRFRIDDENGTTLSLLFVARDAVRPCAPELVPSLDRLVPAEYLTP